MAVITEFERLHLALDACMTADLSGAAPGMLRALLDATRRAHSKIEALLGRVAHRAEVGGALVGSGARDAAEYLVSTGGGAAGRLRAATEVGEALEQSPSLAAAVESGELTLDNAATLLSAVRHPDFESAGGALLKAAGEQTVKKVKQQVGDWLSRHAADQEADRAVQQRQARSLTFTPLADGMTRVNGLLDPLSATRIRASVDAIVQQTQFDDTGRTREQRSCDALVQLCDTFSRGELAGGRSSAQVIISVDYATVFERASGRGRTSSGDSLDAETVRQLCCDAGLHRAVTLGGSRVLDYGSERRLFSPAQYQAMVLRDGGCRWPGCNAPPGWCDAHHIVHVEHGGLTHLDDGVLMCATHHTFAHTPGYRITGTGSHLQIELPDGRTLHSFPSGVPPNAQSNAQPDVMVESRQLALVG